MKQVLRMEALVLKRLQGIDQVCEFISCGKTGQVNYLVMTLLGPNLSELRKKCPHQKFTISTVLRLGVQIIKVIQSMHNSGFLHRDIKPSNFAMGNGAQDSKTCFILDFGLSRQYITPTGELKQPRASAGFRGTVRYASMNAHMGNELGRHDDLWSVFYLLIELAIGQLPWRCIRDKEDVKKAKASCDHEDLIVKLPKEFLLYLEHLKQLTYFDKPNYTYLIQQLEIAQERLGIDQSDLYDWEQQPILPPPPSLLPPPPHLLSSSDDSTISAVLQDKVPLLLLETSSSSDTTISVGHDAVHTNDEKKEVNKSSSVTQSGGIPEGKTDDTVRPPVDIKSSDAQLLLSYCSKTYSIPLPPQPKPAGYFCANARRKRFVKCNDPYVLIK